MNLPEKKQRWVFHADALPQAAGAGVTRRVLAYVDGKCAAAAELTFVIS